MIQVCSEEPVVSCGAVGSPRRVGSSPPVSAPCGPWPSAGRSSAGPPAPGSSAPVTTMSYTQWGPAVVLYSLLKNNYTHCGRFVLYWKTSNSLQPHANTYTPTARPTIISLAYYVFINRWIMFISLINPVLKQRRISWARLHEHKLQVYF